MTTNKGGVGAGVVRNDSNHLPGWNMLVHAAPLGASSQCANGSFPSKIIGRGKKT